MALVIVCLFVGCHLANKIKRPDWKDKNGDEPSLSHLSEAAYFCDSILSYVFNTVVTRGLRHDSGWHRFDGS